MSNQLCYYSFNIIKKNNEQISVTYTSRSYTLAKLKASKYAKEIDGILDSKYTKSLTPVKPNNNDTKKLIQTFFF